MGIGLIKIHANRLAEYRKTYFDTNGDEYQGTINGRLVFVRAGNRSTTTTSTTTNISGETRNTETIIVTEVIEDTDKLEIIIELQSKILTELRILNYQMQNIDSPIKEDLDSLREEDKL